MYVFGGYNGKKCIDDLRRIEIVPPLRVRRELLTATPRRAASIVLRHYRAEASGSLQKRDLERFIRELQSALDTSLWDGRGSTGSLGSRLGSGSGSGSVGEPLRPRASGRRSVRDMEADFSMQELKIVDQVVSMGLSREAVVRSALALKKEKGAVDINRLIDKAVTLDSSSSSLPNLDNNDPDENSHASNNRSSHHNGRGRRRSTDAGKSSSSGSKEAFNNNGVFGAHDDEEPPDALCCPLSCALFEDPVMTDDGHTYSRKLIQDWLKRQQVSPMTNKRLESKTLRPNYVVRDMCEAWLKAKKK